MKPLATKLTSITEDFLQLINQWNENTEKTPGQKKLWPDDKIFAFAGADHPNTLKLLSEDGFDDKPVFSQFTTEQLMNTVTNREVLRFSSIAIVRMSLFFHLNPLQTIILLTKSHWETFLVNQTRHIDLEWLTKTGIAEEFLPLFADDTKELNELKSTWQLLERQFGIEKELGLTDELYNQLIHHILLSRIFHFAILSNEVKAFIGNQLQLISLLKAENSEYNDVYHVRNKQWLYLVQTAENAHLHVGGQRLENAEVERKWLTVFGNDWYLLLQADLTLQSLKRQLEMKLKNPSMSLHELEQADSLIAENEMKQLKNLVTDITLSQIFNEQTQTWTGNHQIDQKLIDQYKKILRLIWIKTHPDKVTDKGFTAEQLELLAKFYQQATELSTAERIIQPLSLKRLEEILGEVEELYRNIGLNITLNTTVKGNTLKEKVEWLESQIKRIEQELTQLKNEMFSLANDSSIKQKESAIKSPEVIEDIKKQMLERKTTLDMELLEFKQQLDQLFR